MFGKLTLEALKHDPIEQAANLSIFLTLFFLIGLLSFTHRWKWLWREWLTSLDPKKIGVMYFVVAILMLFKGLDGRLHDARAAGSFCWGGARLFDRLSFSAGFYGAWLDHDFLRWDGHCVWCDEFSRSLANWRARCRFSLSQCCQFLVIFCRGLAAHHLPCRWQFFCNGLGCLSSAFRTAI